MSTYTLNTYYQPYVQPVWNIEQLLKVDYIAYSSFLRFHVFLPSEYCIILHNARILHLYNITLHKSHLKKELREKLTIGLLYKWKLKLTEIAVLNSRILQALERNLVFSKIFSSLTQILLCNLAMDLDMFHTFKMPPVS